MKLAPAIALVAALALSQNEPEVTLEKAGVGYIFTQGPAWSRDNYLVFSDVPLDKVHKFIAGQGDSILDPASRGAVGQAFDAQGRRYVCESHSRRVVRFDKKKIDVLAERWEGKRLNSPHDIVVRHDGEVYFTDPAFGNQQDHRELAFYGVFHISKKGALELVAKPKGRPNGITLSPNGRILYVSNSDERNVRAYDLDKSGAASGERVLIPHTEGIPGGMCIEENGDLYLAANHVAVYSPDGRKTGEVRVPEKPSNCAFGDPDLQSLYITARTSLYRVRLTVKGALQN